MTTPSSRRRLPGIEAIESALTSGVAVQLIFRRDGELSPDAARVLALAEAEGVAVRVASQFHVDRIERQGVAKWD